MPATSLASLVLLAGTPGYAIHLVAGGDPKTHAVEGVAFSDILLYGRLTLLHHLGGAGGTVAIAGNHDVHAIKGRAA